MTWDTYQKVFEHAPNPIAILDKEFNFISVNRLYAQADNKDILDFPGHNHFEFYPSPENERIFREVVITNKPYITKARPFTYEKNPERGVTYWDWSLIPVLDEKNEVEFLVFSLINVTEHVLKNIRLEKSEKVLKMSEELFNKAFRLNPNIMFIRRLEDDTYITGNDAFIKLIGHNREELYGVSELDLNVWVHREEKQKFINLLREHSSVHNFEILFKTNTGENRNGLISAEIINIFNEPCILGIITDVAEEKQTKDKIIKLAAIVESSNIPIITKTLEGEITSWNSAAERLFGYKAEEVMGKHFSILIPEGVVYEQDILERIKHGEEVNSLETVWRTKQSQIINVSLTVSPLKDEKEQVYGASAVVRDITQRIEIEKELKHEINQRKYSEAHLKAIFDNSTLGIVTFSLDEKVLDYNAALESMLGYSHVELSNMNYEKLNHPEDIQKDKDKVIEVFCGKRDHYEMEKRFLKKDGSVLWVNLTLVRAESAEFKFVISFLQDITEKKLYQEQMVKLDRLNLIGEMAAGISHEVRNPMTTVRGFLQILRNKKDCCHYIDYFDLMIEELDRSNAIITEFLSIGHNIPSNLQKENLNSIIESLVPLIEASAFRQENYLEVDTSEVSDLLINNKEIRQVLLNLCQNGLEAMSPGGTLKIKTYSQDEEIILAVQDEGEGIRPDVLEKLGTPFFTTKEKGTGLGLGVCYSIAARHNANITLDTGPDGTTFYVKFKARNMVCDPLSREYQASI